MQVHRDELLKNLETIRDQHGEAAYNTARMNLVKMLVFSPGGEQFLREAFPDIDLEAVKKEAVASSNQETVRQDLIGAIRSHVPNIQTQAQLDLFMAAFNALALTFDCYFSPTGEGAERARDVLTRALDTASKLRGVVEQVQEIPVEQRSREAQAFTEPPKEFREIEEQRRLLAELAAITSSAGLSEWYNANRTRMEGVVTAQYRNELFDEIRAKKAALAS